MSANVITFPQTAELPSIPIVTGVDRRAAVAAERTVCNDKREKEGRLKQPASLITTREGVSRRCRKSDFRTYFSKVAHRFYAVSAVF